MIDEEIEHAKVGEQAYIGLKMNSLTDKRIMNKLVEASCAGVHIDMVVRGICCLIPGVKGQTENIHIISIVGKDLYFICGLYDKKYSSPCGSCSSYRRPGYPDADPGNVRDNAQ